MKEQKKRIKGKKQGRHAQLDVINKINTTLKKNAIQNAERIFKLNMERFLEDEIQEETEMINDCIDALGFWGRFKFIFKGLQF